MMLGMDKKLVTDTPSDTALGEAGAGAVDAKPPVPWPAAFFSFRYSCTELSTTQDGRTSVRARQLRLEDGRLSSEALEGELAGSVYGEAVRQTQQLALDQLAWLQRWWLPWWLPAPRDEGPGHR